jgi:hypothetical protein
MTTDHPATTHRIKDGQAVCDGDATTACHYFPDCECEYWSFDHDEEHQPAEHPYCWVTPWINSSDLEDSFDGETLPGLDGPCDERPWPDGLIEWTWEGEYVLWHYAAEQTAEAGA